MGGSRNYRQGVGVRDILTKNDFLSLTILQRGPISRKTILFKVPEVGGGGQWKPVLSWFENAINNCVSTSPKCTDVVEALTRLL